MGFTLHRRWENVYRRPHIGLLGLLPVPRADVLFKIPKTIKQAPRAARQLFIDTISTSLPSPRACVCV